MTDSNEVQNLNSDDDGIENGKSPWVHASDAITARELGYGLTVELCLPNGVGGMAGAVLSFMLAMNQIPREKNERISDADLKLAHQLLWGNDLVTGELAEMERGFEKLCEFQSLENLTEFADGCIDSIYVILWAMLKMRLPVAALFNEVQRSNKAKINSNGTVTKIDGKVQKPPGWKPPDLLKILIEHFDTADWNGNIRKD